MKKTFTLIVILIFALSAQAASERFVLRGAVIDEVTRRPIPFAAVTIDGQPGRGAVSNVDGAFVVEGVEPGIFRLIAQSLGYRSSYSADILVAANTPAVEVTMLPTSKQLDSIIVRPSLFRRMVESPVSMRRVGIQQIEKSPGANRDVSRIVQSYPGVAFSPAGYRNDLIVRGGAPSENRFYVDGIEIPNINHFSTEGASGGPVSILNADLIREIEFYSGSFPLAASGAMSSVMDVTLRDGDMERQSFKATLGASEISLSGSGHLSERTSYLFSVRQSYLQLLFKAIGLPFLPNFIDGQIKVRHQLSPREDITLLALTGIDHMTLNEEGTSESAEYILGYLPQIEQQTVTAGVRYRNYTEQGRFTAVASHSYVGNQSTKYQDNESSDPTKLNLRAESKYQKTTLRGESVRHTSDNFSLRYGGDVNYIQYGVDSYRRLSDGENYYDTYLGYAEWGAQLGAGYKSDNGRLTASLGARVDGNTFSAATARFWQHLSPRLSGSYTLPHNITLGGSAAIYYAMPPLTALSYQEGGAAVNGSLNYINVRHLTAGVEWRPRPEIFVSMEGFCKLYRDMPISEENDVPLADLGDDYGSVGGERYNQQGVGRAYGMELSGEWQIPGKLSLVSSLTLYRSEYATSHTAEYRPSAWDSRLIFNSSGTYFLSRGWSIGAKLSAIGGAPYTPYDEELSSLIMNWDVTGAPILDYSLYNTQRLGNYAQLDLRIDKMYYFKKWMLGVYLDIQNISQSKYHQPDIPISTGVVDPNDTTKYQMKYLENISGTMLPTLGITAQF